MNTTFILTVSPEKSSGSTMGIFLKSTDEKLRKGLVEEMADVLMYYNDVMLCYGITAEELKQAYTEKFEKNMKRW